MKKLLNNFFILLLVCTSFIVSKSIHKNTYSYINNLVKKSDYTNITYNNTSIQFLSNNNTYYKLEGDACQKKEYTTFFDKIMTENEYYLCKVTETNELSYSGSKNVEITFENLNYGHVNIFVYEINSDGNETHNSYYYLYSGENTITLEYKYNYDYKIYVYSNLYNEEEIIDNLKSSELDEDNVTRKYYLTSKISLEQDLNLTSIYNKITSDNNIKKYNSSINFANISPQISSYKETSTETNISISNSYYYFADTYSFDNNKGTFSLNNPTSFKISNSSPINKYTSLSSGNYNYGYVYKINSGPDENGKYNVTKISSIVDSYDSGLYEYNTSNGTTYFYRGAVENNYVKFAGFIWRIIRINEDGSIRMILDGDIGSVKWNDSIKYGYYTGYTYGNIKYQPLTKVYKSGWGYSNIYVYIDTSKKYCYSDTYTFDMKNENYKLSGDVVCKSLSYESDEMYNKYTLLEETKNATSKEITKLSYNYRRDSYNATKYTVEETEVTPPKEGSSSKKYTLYYSDSYEIVEGKYKLINSKKLEFTDSEYYSADRTLKGKYILLGDYSWTVSKNATASKLFKINEVSRGKLKGILFDSTTFIYENTKSNSSNPKKILDEWYNKNLSGYSQIAQSTFCNDTGGTKNTYSNTFSVNDASNRLTSKTVTPSFECNGTFDFGGKYYDWIGLITADEMVFAGAANNKINNKYYLAYYKPYWTMTPASAVSMFTSTIGLYNYDTENINSFGTESLNAASASGANLYVGDSSIAVRPVINIDRNSFTYVANAGTKGDPYEIITDYNIIDAYNSR